MVKNPSTKSASASHVDFVDIVLVTSYEYVKWGDFENTHLRKLGLLRIWTLKTKERGVKRH